MLDGGEWSAPHSGHITPSDWVPEHIWKLWRRTKSLVPPKNQTTIPRSHSAYASHYSDKCIHSESLEVPYLIHKMSFAIGSGGMGEARPLNVHEG